MKTDVEFLEFMWPMRHFLITCGNIESRKNITAVSFCMPVSKKPAQVAIAITKESYSYELISETREFAVNIPLQDFSSQIYYCGFHSGRDVDKFEETGFSAVKAKKIHSPVIGECIAHMECRYAGKKKTGDKVLIIGDVVEAYADKSLSAGLKFTDYAFGDFPRKIYSTRFSKN